MRHILCFVLCCCTV